MTNLRISAAALATCLAILIPASAATSSRLTTSGSVPGPLDESLRHEVEAAINRALDWLAANQQPGGTWSNASFPALTALPLRAFLAGTHPRKDAIVDKGLAYLQSCIQTNGAICREVPGRKGGGLSNYNTAICMVTLHASGRPAFIPAVRKARQFVAAAQYLGEDTYKGGFGYDKVTNRAYTDLLNTYYSMEAMRLTQAVEGQDQARPRTDINWAAATAFVEQMQNKPEAGADQAGGFVYNPNDPKGGAITNQNGTVVFRSYGSITYVGMLALMYADVSPADPRIKSALDWAVKHWSLDENPGMGQQGLYFFYHILTRSLTATGQDRIPQAAGEQLNWREAVAKKLVSRQRIDPATGHGYWVNEDGRYWENDPVLTTSYTLLALQQLL